MDPQSTKQILDYLDKIGEKLDVGTQMVWPWFVRQVYIDVFLAWLFFTLTSTILFFIYRYVMRHWDYPRNDEGQRLYGYEREGLPYSICQEDHEGFWVTICIIAGVFALIGVFNVIICGFDWLNPEYHALKSLLKSINPVKG